MTGVVVLAVLCAIGLIGVWSGLRSAAPPLEGVWAMWQGPVEYRSQKVADRSITTRAGAELASRLTASRWADQPLAHKLLTSLAITDSDLPLFASRVVVTAGICGSAPFVAWLVLLGAGSSLPLALAVVLAVAAVPLTAALQVSSLFQQASQRRRHFRVVIGSFVDLVVLSLAGGVGIDGALFAASQVTPEWAARRMAHALLQARDGGVAPWTALAAVGVELDVPELVELSTTVQLAGTEGARIRQSLTARGASLRRHEQAEAESAANAMTERLFLPGALLLLGFLVFIGFPAVQRILGGF